MLNLFGQAGEAGVESGRFLPIADLTAVALERALLSADKVAAERALTAALIGDPVLAAWATRLANAHAVTSPRTAAEAAAWLVANLARHLHAAVRICESNNCARRLSRAEKSRYAWVYGRAVLEARTAVQNQSGSHTLDNLANNAVYFSSMRSAVERSFPDASRQDANRPVDPYSHYFAAEQPGVEWRLPALVAKLAECAAQVADFERRLEHEKLEALKGLAYGASHEINNPLANIAARAQTLLSGENNAERRRKLTAIHRQAMRAHEMISDLMLFARPPRLESASCDVRSIVESIIEELREDAFAREIEINYRLDDERCEISGDSTQLAVALKALVTNSLEAIGTAGRIEIVAKRADMGGVPMLEVTVADDGSGISEAVRRHMFDPFFSGREAGRGLGFGLAKCWRIVTDHGGQVVVHEPSRRGAEISMLLPCGPPSNDVGVEMNDNVDRGIVRRA